MLDHLSPLPYSPISILLKLTSRPPGPRTPGWSLPPTPRPSRVGGLTGLRPLPPTPEKTSRVNGEELVPLREGRASFPFFGLTAKGLLPLH